jgi:hypothetical protein
MPYRSKAERELPLWMTLVEAVAHIQAQEGCDQIEALRQLRVALGEGEIPARWAAAPLPPLGPLAMYVGSPPLFSSDAVPTDALFWNHALIFLVGNGRVIDQSFLLDDDENRASEGGPRPRELFLLRTRVLEHWPLPSEAREDSNRVQSGSSDQPKKRRPKPASKSVIRKTIKELYQQAGNNPPNQTKAEPLIAGVLPGTPRTLIRPILREEEFKRLRRKPGKQPKL